MKRRKMPRHPKEYQEREFVIELSSKGYSGANEYLKFSLVQEGCSKIDSFEINDNLNVSYEVKAREWVNPENETVYINDVRAISVKINTEEVKEPIDMTGDGSDLPF